MARRNGLTRSEAISEGWLAMAALVIGGGPADFAGTDRAAEMLRRSGEGNVLANLLAISAPARAISGDNVGADRDITELDALAASIGDEMSAINHRLGHGMLALMRADWETTVESFAPFGAAAGAVPYAAPIVAHLAVAEAFSGRLDEAERHADFLIDNVMDLGGVVTAGTILAHALVAIARDDLERAWEITYDQSTGEAAFENPFSSLVVVLFARVTAQLGKHEEAVRIAGAVLGDTEHTGLWAALLGDLVPASRTALGESRFDELWAEGAAMGGPQAVALVKRGRGSRQRPMLGWDALTPTEAEVAALVAKGVSNRDVAGQLFMSEATVKTHLTRIYNKVGVKNRAQLAASARQPS
jgi:DNA-binding CsgD family transcriptional regulator